MTLSSTVSSTSSETLEQRAQAIRWDVFNLRSLALYPFPSPVRRGVLTYDFKDEDSFIVILNTFKMSTYCSGLMIPDTHLGENIARYRGV